MSAEKSKEEPVPVPQSSLKDEMGADAKLRKLEGKKSLLAIIDLLSEEEEEFKILTQAH